MTGVQCVHCGEVHPPSAMFCPATGRALSHAPPANPQPGYAKSGPPPAYGSYVQPPYAQPAPPPDARQPPPWASPSGPPPWQGPSAAPPGHGPPPYVGANYASPQAPQFGLAPAGLPRGMPSGQVGKPVGIILREAFELYRRHLSTLLVTCAIILVPLSLLKAATVALIQAPATAVVDIAANNAQSFSERAAELQRQIIAAQGDPKKSQDLAREEQKALEDYSRGLASTRTAVVGGLMAWVLGFVAVLLGIALTYFVAIPLITGALTIVVADRATGGSIGPGEAYRLLLRRLGTWASAWIPAFFLELLGLFFLLIPGLVLGFLFAFVTPVVIIENVGGIAALKRSVALVKANIGQVALVWLVFIGIRIVTSILSHLFVPTSAYFVDSLVQDALLLFLLPLPVIGSVLLYLDIRRQADGLDEHAVRAGIDGLRTA